MFSDGTAISLEGISKRYYLRSQRPTDLKTTVLHLPSFLWRDSSRKAFWALDDVSFTVRRGESMGIIGPNGSGKSTLLKIMADLARPTRGKINVNGRISALLELGAGFHPQITGRENAILNAVLLGLTRREAAQVLPDIIAFSELGDFIDEPMRTYSSGMYIRLGFSVAVHVHADVLLVDEVLAVGDGEFQEKCFDHIAKLRAQGVTIVLVSHDLGSVTRFCERAILLHHGKVQLEGKSQPVVHEYLSRIAALIGHAVSS
ncbi:MAG: ABC transporter ATP-binding protein [Dehalococcoidia bacterium]|jgi:ABC-2 type transport system ATP-binding protein/lipopolysaccharide transport system ATP-binding protein